MIIAIDGPAGSGKSTIANRLSKKLGLEYIDSGALYRAMTWYGLECFKEELPSNVEKVLQSFMTRQVILKVYWDNSFQKVRINGEDVSDKIRTPEVTNNVRWIANSLGCREFVNKRIRKLAQDVSFIIDGRDIGTEVFPHSKNKFYLDASSVVRAKRRAKELNVDVNSASFDELHQQIIDRDNSDKNRSIAPLRKAEDAHYIDTSDMDLNQVIEVISNNLTEKGHQGF